MRKLYEFKCLVCDYYQEALVKGEEDYPHCPNEHGAMAKAISAPSFHFENGAGTNAGRAWAFHGRPLWGGMS